MLGRPRARSTNDSSYRLLMCTVRSSERDQLSLTVTVSGWSTVQVQSCETIRPNYGLSEQTMTSSEQRGN